MASGLSFKMDGADDYINYGGSSAASINLKQEILIVEIKEGTKRAGGGNSHPCKICNKKFISKLKLKAHLNSSHCNKYSCSECTATFRTKKLLAKHNTGHRRKEKEKISKYYCCGKLFVKKESLEKHIKTHECFQIFECDFCRRIFNKKKNLCLHMIKHTSKDICERCKKHFSSTAYLHKHQLHCMSGDALYPCGECTFKANSLKDLNSHFERQHYAKYICSYCCKGFRVKHRLLDHERRHIGDCPFICEYCGKAYHSKVSIQQHLKIHILPRTHECDICHKKFLRKSKLMDHKNIHFDHLKKHKCAFCNAAFHERTGLKNHLRTHTQEKPFECEVCNKHFSSNYSLKSHSNLHKETKEVKRFPCNQCDKAFDKAAHLKRHSLTHTGERPHTCEVCWHRFAQMSQLITHKVLKHKILPYPCSKCGERFKIKSDMMTHMMDHVDNVIDV
jgi:KRAB domain-containing zinc finger protein